MRRDRLLFVVNDFPPLLGGVAIIVLIALLTRAQRAWRGYDARTPSP